MVEDWIRVLARFSYYLLGVFAMKFPKIDFSDIPTVKADDVLLYVCFILGIALLGIYNNFPGQEKAATIFFIMIIVWGMSILAELQGGKGDFYSDVAGVGKNPLFALGVGLITAVGLLLFVSLNKATVVAFVGVSDVFWRFFFVVVTAPIVEANFFRGLVLPHTMGLIRRNCKLNRNVIAGISILVTSIVFAWFHWFVLGGNINDLGFMFVFSVIASIGVYATRSIFFEYGMHGLWNTLAFLSG